MPIRVLRVCDHDVNRIHLISIKFGHEKRVPVPVTEIVIKRIPTPERQQMAHGMAHDVVQVKVFEAVDEIRWHVLLHHRRPRLLVLQRNVVIP